MDSRLSVGTKKRLGFDGYHVCIQCLSNGSFPYRISISGSVRVRLREKLKRCFEINMMKLTETDKFAAWERTKSLIDKGIPTICLTDMYYLSYAPNYNTRHSTHTVTILGYNDSQEVAIILDQFYYGTVPLLSLIHARNSTTEEGPLRNCSFNFSKDSCNPIQPNELNIATALKEITHNMLNKPSINETYYGINGIKILAEDVQHNWLTQVIDDNTREALFKQAFHFINGSNGPYISRLYLSDFFAFLSHVEYAPNCYEIAQIWEKISMEWLIVGNLVYKASKKLNNILLKTISERLLRIASLEEKEFCNLERFACHLSR